MLLSEVKPLYLYQKSLFHHLPSVGPKQFCVLAHLGFKNKEGISQYKPILHTEN